MPTGDGSLIDFLGILAVFLLVAANGFFVAAEFSMVAVRRSRVQRLVAKGKRNAKALDRALSQLDANLAACQLGITVSSLGLGWIGEPALARLIEPLLFGLGRFALAGAHVIAVVIAFSIITALHIVLGELMPKSLALQRSERTALAVVRPLWLFRVLLWPAIVVLNGIGNWLLKLCGLKPGTAEEALHSPEELKLLIAASQEGGLLQPAQQQLVERVLSIGNRRITDIMTPRVDLEWIDIEDTPEETLKTIRDCRHEQLLVGKAGIDEPFGMVLKKDLLDQILAGKKLDVMAALRQPIIVPEPMPIFKVLD
jgi:CBS domain containing-hemolysin-like protein